MKDSIRIDWKQDMVFEAEVDGFRIILDTKKGEGEKGAGPRPKPLAMVSLAGCTAMDVISILKKMKVDVDEFTVTVEGTLTDEHPKKFTAMHIVYSFRGKDLPTDKLERAIQLSLEKYCGISATYKNALHLTHEIKLL